MFILTFVYLGLALGSAILNNVYALLRTGIETGCLGVVAKLNLKRCQMSVYIDPDNWLSAICFCTAVHHLFCFVVVGPLNYLYFMPAGRQTNISICTLPFIEVVHQFWNISKFKMYFLEYIFINSKVLSLILFSYILNIFFHNFL